MHAAAQSVYEYVWHVKWDRGRETGDWENQTHIQTIVNHVWRQDYLHAGVHVNYHIARLTWMWNFGMII